MCRKLKLLLIMSGSIHFIALHTSLKMMVFKNALLLNTVGNLGYSYIKDTIKYRDIPTYTFNYMAINRNSSATSYLYPAKNKDEAHKVLDIIFKTAAVTPKNKGVVALWYDSEYTSCEAIQDIKNKITLHNQQHSHHARIVVRDIRSLEQVQKNPDAFSSHFPVFFRVDLARVIATLETLEKRKESYFVYSDMDLEKPLGPEKLFSPSMKKILDEYGVVLQGSTAEREKLFNPGLKKMLDEYNTLFNPDQKQENIACENQFHIVSKNDKEIRQALQFVVVDLAICRTKTTPAHKRKFLGESVWTSYKDMLDYLYHLKGWGKLFNWQTCKPYNKETDGLTPFAIDITKQPPAYSVTLHSERPLPVTFEPSYPPRCFKYNWI